MLLSYMNGPCGAGQANSKWYRFCTTRTCRPSRAHSATGTSPSTSTPTSCHGKTVSATLQTRCLCGNLLRTHGVHFMTRAGQSRLRCGFECRALNVEYMWEDVSCAHQLKYDERVVQFEVFFWCLLLTWNFVFWGVQLRATMLPAAEKT